MIHSHNFHGNMLARLCGCSIESAARIYHSQRLRGGAVAHACLPPERGLVDRTTAVSAAVAKRFVKLKAVARDKCVVITNGIETAEFVPDPKRRAVNARADGRNG